jgi:hypothetical protein
MHGRKWLSEKGPAQLPEIRMIAFYLSLAALGAAGAALIRELAAAQARQRAALRRVQIQSADRSSRRG